MSIAPAIPDGFEAALAAFNPRLRVRWDHEQTLWVIEERGRTDGNWYYVLFWADRDARGGLHFRRLPETPGPILERLHEIDVSRFERAPKHCWQALVSEMDGTRKDYMQAHLSQKQDETAQSIKDKWRYYMRGKRTFRMHEQSVPDRGT